MKFSSNDGSAKRHGLAFEGSSHSLDGMKEIGFTYWQDGPQWIGHLDDFPDYDTQGESLEDLKAHLADLHRDLTSGAIPNVRHHAKLTVA